MNEHPRTRFVDAAAPLLSDRGFTTDEAIVWMTLRAGHHHLPLRVHTLIDEYIAANIEPHHAMGWFLLHVPEADAQSYNWRGWTPTDLLSLRHAIYESEQPQPSRPSPLNSQPYEVDWIYSDVTPALVPLCVIAGHDPAGAEALDRKHRDGDTTVVPALRAIAALRNTAVLAQRA